MGTAMKQFQSAVDRSKVMNAQIKWLSEIDFNFTITLHYYQRKLVFLGHSATVMPISREQAAATTKHFMNKIDRALLGKSAQKQGAYIFRAAFHEIDAEGRLHTHLHVKIPFSEMSEILSQTVAECAKGIDWIDRKPFVEALTPGTHQNFVAYCHKDGLDAFCPESSLWTKNGLSN